MSHIRSAVLDARGFVVLDRFAQDADSSEWNDLEYVDWKSSGDTRFAPLTSASGDIETDAFWNHAPPRTDKDGIWIPSQIEKAPHLTQRAQEPGANVGRCRVIELQPNDYTNTVYNLHQDDNNRLNPDGTGWIVRAFFNLTDDPDSLLILREDRFDPSTEIRIPLHAGTQVIVDTQRFWHAVWHPGPAPRYCLITSWESGPQLDRFITTHHGSTDHTNAPLEKDTIDAAGAEARRRLADRSVAVADRGREGRTRVDPAE